VIYDILLISKQMQMIEIEHFVYMRMQLRSRRTAEPSSKNVVANKRQWQWLFATSAVEFRRPIVFGL
jgi:hypothetical protein